MAFLDAIVRWSLRNQIIVLMGVGLFAIYGMWSATKLPIDAVPDVTNIQVQLITTSPALSPVEIEKYVTVPVERALAGTPNVTDIRSLSKYGLSVVTVVFEDATNIHLARQLVSERLPAIYEAIPARYGRPEMGPISTGLGEIYQFVVRGEGHSLMALEETLDWYIAPQLRMVPGVVEVNSFGGENKEYQVLVDAQRLQAVGLSIEDVARALERANANAGGGYIERFREQLVIGTTGMLTSLEELKSAVIGATAEGMPITVATVGEVRFGPKMRRGAASMDGKGEVVVGVTLMLMGANSRTVTENVKNKVAELQNSLPKGMRIEPFYDRAALVDRTIHTVGKNLAEGALLVILVLFLLLGDWRAGLIVATTIPLALLFAIVLMNGMGLSGNLMSLGAIDFGLIVDAAVIIVENAVRRLGEARRRLGRTVSADEQTEIVRNATLEVRGASVFGEAIIAIVYLPILALRGVEGKLFQPMALTVLFALLGAFIFSLTWIPTLASRYLKPSTEEKETWFMRKAHAVYVPLLASVFGKKKQVIAVSAFLIIAAIGIFTQLGAEFVPQLDEGDLLIELRRLPGVSLTEAVAIDQRLQKALMHIPEIQHVVTRTGAPELAVDPMGFDAGDVYIQLKPRDQWRKGLSKEELGEEIMEVAEREVPEAACALSQPIQMRTNELVAGVRSDVAAQIYGPDLEVLQTLGDQVGRMVQAIPGATDVRVEQGSGLSYLRIKPDRIKLARYGLTVEDVNAIAETTAVGRIAGVVFEDDRRFNLVVKFRDLTPSPEAFSALPLKSATGQIVPLGDVAEVVIEAGPAVVNRDHQSRRRIVEFNVRGRDLLSVVDEAQAEVESKLDLPTGYYIAWGGQFQHFIDARARLLIVVPLALALILFLLWMAFSELKPSLLIFLNIPFAVVGGVFALWVRGLPFSISAGVGFIALFGVAVLNGLVLLAFCRQLEADGVAPMQAIRTAAELRLRPVLMTAMVAALGFLPMALSTSPGSEVQRPLATVVIGGLLTATALTLLLLPLLYSVIHKREGT